MAALGPWHLSRPASAHDFRHHRGASCSEGGEKQTIGFQCLGTGAGEESKHGDHWVRRTLQNEKLADSGSERIGPGC